MTCAPLIAPSFASLHKHIADGATVFAHACQLGAEGIVSKRVDGTFRAPARVPSGSRFAIPPASLGSGSAARFGIGAPGSGRQSHLWISRFSVECPTSPIERVGYALTSPQWGSLNPITI
jgi:hypothetical protein